MKTVTIIRETFLLLRRDRVFVPVAVIALGVFFFANLASDWGIEEFTKILYDIGAMGYHVLGVVVAIFWGIKLINDSKQQGSLEIQMASPIGRVQWLVGRYLGLCCTLLLLSALLLIAWQVMLYLNWEQVLTKNELLIFVFLTLDWLVIAALAVFFASMASQAVATFCCLCAWFAGLTSASLVQALAKDTPPVSKAIIEGLAKAWNLQLFNLTDFAWVQWFPVKETFPKDDVLLGIAGYGGCLILILISSACVAFSRKDLTTSA